MLVKIKDLLYLANKFETYKTEKHEWDRQLRKC